ncbi:MAG: outer membrane protein transport protein [Thermodesulfobacteriota bacterium]|nr:outer membrane protein transport protein [Thermodesulfobacteriota bacterium]
MLPAVGYKVNENFSVGLSFGIGYQSMRLKMPYQVHSGALAGNVMVADMRMEGSDYCSNLGILYKVNDAVKIGFVYKSETKINMSGDANVDASALGAGTAKYDVEATYKWPQSAGVGISYLATPKLLVAADVEWINWKKAMQSLEFEFSQGNSGLLPPALNDELPLDWDDQYVFRLGVEYEATENLDLRCGVTYGKSPIPDNTVMSILCTIIEWSATIGLGYNVTEDVSFNAAYLHSFDHTQDSDVSLIGNEYDGSSTGVSIDAIYMGLTVNF